MARMMRIMRILSGVRRVRVGWIVAQSAIGIAVMRREGKAGERSAGCIGSAVGRREHIGWRVGSGEVAGVGGVIGSGGGVVVVAATAIAIATCAVSNVLLRGILGHSAKHTGNNSSSNNNKTKRINKHTNQGRNRKHWNSEVKIGS